MRRTTVLLAWLIVTAPLAAQQWPSFRGANASGVADEKPTPAKWNAPGGENLLWKTPIPGRGHSSPIIWGAMRS